MNHARGIELWAGIECTVNRVGDRYIDQLVKNGHADRIEDLERVAALGVRTLRYPLLWERTAPNGLSQASWDWADRRLHRLAELGIRPVVGLVHHGSGPPETNLLAPDFAERLAEFALALARRYPWLSAYTPVNEPLTTARFSALYGHWYPHRKDDRSFLRTLVAQCRGVVLSMQAIRSVNPSAELVQTEDMGRTYSTPELAYQAEMENHRRLLSFDFLTGALRDHPLTDYLFRHGVTEDTLDWFIKARCRPDVLGINYYVTSDRFLDERIERYPSWSHGGNGRDFYADVAAVNVWREGITGFERLLTDLWRRYHLPVCVTEAHLGCTREEQMRWLLEAWDGAHAAAEVGAEVRAVTAWSLLGAFDWNSLVMREEGYYEPGAFDVRSSVPRRTGLADIIEALAADGRFDHPVLSTPGWWRRSARLLYPAVGPAGNSAEPQAGPAEFAPTHSRNQRPLAIVGANGTLGRAFVRLCPERGIDCVALSRRDVDIAEWPAVDRLLRDLRPWAVINAAGYVRVDEAESDGLRCERDNVQGAANLAEVCRRHGIKLLTYSSDLVFDGRRTDPYLESHPVAPLNTYGRSKAEAERVVIAVDPTALVIRTSAFFGPWDSSNFVSLLYHHLGEGRSVRTSASIVSPTYVPDLVHASLDLLIDGERGLWHLANRGAVSWYELAKTAAVMASFDQNLIEASEPHALGWAALRPTYSALGSERGSLLPDWESSLERYLNDRQQAV